VQKGETWYVRSGPPCKDVSHLVVHLLQNPRNLSRIIPRTPLCSSSVSISHPRHRSGSLTVSGAETLHPCLGIIRFAANETGTDVDPTPTSAVEESSGSTIPWRISNKYYTADVHFESITTDQYLTRRSEFDGVPAVSFVWDRGQVSSRSPTLAAIQTFTDCSLYAAYSRLPTEQPHREHFERLSGAVSSLDPEIKLAIQFSTDKSISVVTTASSSDDDQEVGEFVSSHGFEYIDGDNDNRARVLDLDDDSTGESFSPHSSNSPATATSVTRARGTVAAPRLTFGTCGT